jgi:hypothetical protein
VYLLFREISGLGAVAEYQTEEKQTESPHTYLGFSFKKFLEIHLKIITFDFSNLSVNQNLALLSFYSLFLKVLISCPLMQEYLLNHLYISLTFIVHMKVS